MTAIWGILNVTPDSFSDGGRYLDADTAIARARMLTAHGAAVIDVGGESTRPGAARVPLAEEQRIPLVNPAANSPRLIGASKDSYLISAIANVSLEAEVAMNYATRVLNAKKMAFIYRNDDFGNGLKDIAVDMWRKTGGEVVAQENHELSLQ